MSGKNQIKNFAKVIESGYTKDLDDLTSSMITHIDEFVIDQKFQEGFPGHQLQKSTIKKKGNDKVGEDTGKLRRAATLFTNWSVWPSVLGTVRHAAVKKRHGLTAYANMVKTKIGGAVDYLALGSDDIVKIQGFVRERMTRKGYSGNFNIRVFEKDAGEE